MSGVGLQVIDLKGFKLADAQFGAAGTVRKWRSRCGPGLDAVEDGGIQESSGQ